MECNSLVLKLEPKSPISSAKRNNTLSLIALNSALDKFLYGLLVLYSLGYQFTQTSCHYLQPITVFLLSDSKNRNLFAIRFNQTFTPPHNS